MAPSAILVVEDDPNDAELTVRALRTMRYPCSITVADSGREAFEYLLEHIVPNEDGAECPCVVFLDNTLPGMSGAELVQKIRSEQLLRSVPLVVLSGSSDETLVDHCLRSGANSFLEKPVDVDAYQAQIRAAAEYWLRLNLRPIGSGAKRSAYSPSDPEKGLL